MSIIIYQVRMLHTNLKMENVDETIYVGTDEQVANYLVENNRGKNNELILTTWEDGIITSAKSFKYKDFKEFYAKKYDIYCQQMKETVHTHYTWNEVREFAFQLACDRANPSDDEMNDLTLECIEHAKKGLELFTDESVKSFLDLYSYEVIESE